MPLHIESAIVSTFNWVVSTNTSNVFTKGFFVSIPFDLFVLKPAKGQGKFPWVPISRDGGQPLQRPVDLYELTDIKAPFSR